MCIISCLLQATGEGQIFASALMSFQRQLSSVMLFAYTVIWQFLLPDLVQCVEAEGMS